MNKLSASLLALSLSFTVERGAAQTSIFTAVRNSPANWNSEAWKSSSEGEVEAGLLPMEGAQVQLMNCNYTLNSETPLLSGMAARDGTLTLASGADLRFKPVGSFGMGFRVKSKFKLIIEEGAQFNVAGENQKGSFILARHADAEGVVEQNGGLVKFTGPKYGLVFGVEPTSHGVYRLTGGRIAIDGFFSKGRGTAEFDWTGGVLTAGGTNIEDFKNTGTGILDIGGEGTVDPDGFTHFHNGRIYQQGPQATMRVDIASASSYDQFLSTGTQNKAVLNGEIDVHVADGFQPKSSDVFDIVVAPEIVDEGVKLTGPGAALFKIEKTKSGEGSDVLRLKSAR